MIYYKLIIEKNSIYYYHLIKTSICFNQNIVASNYELLETNNSKSFYKIGTNSMLLDSYVEIITDEDIIKRLDKLITFK